MTTSISHAGWGLYNQVGCSGFSNGPNISSNYQGLCGNFTIEDTLGNKCSGMLGAAYIGEYSQTLAAICPKGGNMIVIPIADVQLYR